MARRRRLARRRRAVRVQDFRVDERARQRLHREHRARSTSSGADCHAPASPPKAAQWAEKLLDSWDTAVALSRASLQRRIVAILRTLEPTC